jgi:hypothetical protein
MRNAGARLEELASADRCGYVLDDALPPLWFQKRAAITAGQWQPLNNGMGNFNDALHDLARDRYFIARWDSAAVKRIAVQGYPCRDISRTMLEID